MGGKKDISVFVTTCLPDQSLKEQQLLVHKNR